MEKPSGPDVVHFGKISANFKDAESSLSKLLKGSPRDQIQALSALQGRPSLALGSPILAQITLLAVKDEDYSKLEKLVGEIRASDFAEPKMSSELSALSDRAEARRMALAISVANSVPEAVATMKKLSKSESGSERFVASTAQKWYDLYGTTDSPKLPPQLYITRMMPFDQFVSTVQRDLNSGDPKKSAEGVQQVVRNINMRPPTGEAREVLVSLLDMFLKNSSENSESETTSMKYEVIRTTSIAGGEVAKQLLIRESKRTNSPIADDAASGLEFLEAQEEKRPPAQP